MVRVCKYSTYTHAWEWNLKCCKYCHITQSLMVKTLADCYPKNVQKKQICCFVQRTKDKIGCKLPRFLLPKFCAVHICILVSCLDNIQHHLPSGIASFVMNTEMCSSLLYKLRKFCQLKGCTISIKIWLEKNLGNRMREKSGGEKLANHELFAKIFLANSF